MAENINGDQGWTVPDEELESDYRYTEYQLHWKLNSVLQENWVLNED